jgi:Arylsulfatase A and related enzymes
MLGRVLHAIDENGLAGNTLVIFTSDNGADWKVEDKAKYAHRANANWRGEKADIWDGGHRIPFLARWPGKIKPDTVSGQLGCLTDLMATVAGIVNSPLPRNAGEDSFNLAPALLGQSRVRYATRSCITPIRACSPSGRGIGSWNWGWGQVGSVRRSISIPRRAARRGSSTTWPRIRQSPTMCGCGIQM